MTGRHAAPGPHTSDLIITTLQAAADRFDTWLASGGPQPALDGATIAAIKELLREVNDA